MALDCHARMRAELGVAEGEALRVVNAGVVSDDDLASIVGYSGGDTPGGSKGRALERGFAGTALAGILPLSIDSP